MLTRADEKYIVFRQKRAPMKLIVGEGEQVHPETLLPNQLHDTH